MNCAPAAGDRSISSSRLQIGRDEVGQEALKFVPFSNGVPFHPVPTLWTGFIQYGRFGAWRSHVSPLYSIGDDLSWTHGKHAFKGGFEFRNTMSRGFGDPGFTPFATFGARQQSGQVDSTARCLRVSLPIPRRLRATC